RAKRVGARTTDGQTTDGSFKHRTGLRSLSVVSRLAQHLPGEGAKCPPPITVTRRGSAAYGSREHTTVSSEHRCHLRSEVRRALPPSIHPTRWIERPRLVRYRRPTFAAPAPRTETTPSLDL